MTDKTTTPNLYDLLSKGLAHLTVIDPEGSDRLADLAGTSLVLMSTDQLWQVRLCIQEGRCVLLPYEPEDGETKVIGGVQALLGFLHQGVWAGYSSEALLDHLEIEGDEALARKWFEAITSFRPSLTAALRLFTGTNKAGSDG